MAKPEEDVDRIKKALRLALDVKGVLQGEEEKQVHESIKKISKALAKAIERMAADVEKQEQGGA